MYAGSVAYMCEIVLSEDVLAAWLCQTIIQHFIYIFAEIFFNSLGIQPNTFSLRFTLSQDQKQNYHFL